MIIIEKHKYSQKILWPAPGLLRLKFLAANGIVQKNIFWHNRALATARIVIGLAPLRTKARGRTNCVSFSVDLSHLVQSSIRSPQLLMAVSPNVSFLLFLFSVLIFIFLNSLYYDEFDFDFTVSSSCWYFEAKFEIF